jgi:hypothetical protein
LPSIFSFDETAQNKIAARLSQVVNEKIQFDFFLRSYSSFQPNNMEEYAKTNKISDINTLKNG